MSETERQPAPEQPKNPDADQPVAHGKSGPPPHDSIEGPCACGGPHWPGDCPTV